MCLDLFKVPGKGLASCRREVSQKPREREACPGTDSDHGELAFMHTDSKRERVPVSQRPRTVQTPWISECCGEQDRAVIPHSYLR